MKKNTESIASRMQMRVDLESPMVVVWSDSLLHSHDTDAPVVPEVCCRRVKPQWYTFTKIVEGRALDLALRGDALFDFPRHVQVGMPWRTLYSIIQLYHYDGLSIGTHCF